MLQIKESGDTRIVVDGEPGSGKTTFVKRLCYLWAKRCNGETNDGSFRKLGDYKLILPILLRFINTENSLINILKAQFKSLNICEVCAVFKHLEEIPKDILLLLDGYDECKEKSYIENVILRKECSEVICITTSRYHVVEQIKRHSSQAVQQHVRLCRFSEDEIKQYIKQFCQCHGLSPNTEDELMKTLKKRPDLLEVAKVPIRTEMICVVWSVYGNLGDTIADLYEMFIFHLFTHWDKKIPTSCQFVNLSKDEIWRAIEPLLLEVGKIANTWTKHNNLCSMFSDKELEAVPKCDCKKLINIGLLTKSYTSSTAQASKWSFPHLTFQEYFIAYLLGNDKNDDLITSFAARCKQYHYHVLSKYEPIFAFLTSKYPVTAGKILSQLLLKETDQKRCEELFDIICEQFQHVLVCQGMNIPLPVHLNLDSHKNLNFKVLDLMFEANKKQKESNLRHLSTDRPIKFKKFLDILDINELRVTICSEEEMNLVNLKLKQLCNLTSLSINSTVSFFLSDHYDILKTIQEKKLTFLSITGPGALEAVAKNVHRFISLVKLEVGENSSTNDETNGQKILSVLKGKKSMEQVSFSVMDLNGIIIKEDVKIKVMVRVKKLQPGTMKVTSDLITFDSTVALHTLDLSRNSLEHEGRPLGELMVKVSGLRVLSLADCTLKHKTIKEMVDATTRVQYPCHLQTLNMGHYENHNRNKLHSAGAALGKLIKYMPELQILDLEDCNLKSNDFGAMSDAMSESTTKLHTLNLSVNELGEAKEGGFLFLQHMSELQAFKAGGYNSDDPIPAICGAIDTGVLKKLSILDVSDSSVESTSLEMLGEHLHLVKYLEVLNLKGLEGVKLKDYEHIYQNIPPSLTHLNMSTDQEITKETINPYDILDNKHHFSKLCILSMTLTESDLEMLQEGLEEINHDIKVYCKAKVNIWGIDVLEKMKKQKEKMNERKEAQDVNEKSKE